MATDSTTTTPPPATGDGQGTTTDPDPKTTTTPPTGTPATTDPDADGDVAKWKELSRKNEAELRKAQAELDKIRKANETDTEKAVREAEERGRTTALASVTARLISSEIKVAASPKLQDPADAEALLGDVSRFADKDGNVDAAAIGKAIDDLLKSKPYLGKTATGALEGGGRKTSSTGFNFNDEIRGLAGRG